MHDKPLEKYAKAEGLSDWARYFEPLAPRTSFRIGGYARVMLTPRTKVELQKSLLFCKKYEQKPKILGGGSNLLIVKQALPVVISLRKLKEIRFQDDMVYVGAGTALPHLVRKTIERGLQGLEVLNGIPGTVGGALAGNAGGGWNGKRMEIGEFVREVKILDDDANILCLSKSAIKFSYRSSSLNNHIIVEAAFQLRPALVSELENRYKAVLCKKKQSQPLNARSAGCVFKNPPGVSAWKLISQAGLVGKKIGAAMVSKKHANFIVNQGGACGADVLKLIEHVRVAVKRLSGIDLILEVKLW